MKKTKKVNYKDMAKKEIREKIEELFATSTDFTVESGLDYGYTKDTLVLHGEKCDIQVKLISPKSGIDRYTKDEE